MFESKKDFENNIDNLVNHLNYDNARFVFLRNILKKYNCRSAIKDEIENHVRTIDNSSLLNAKRFTYTNSIISLYGFLENFIENIAREFIVNLNEIHVPFLALPKEIRLSHLELSIDLIKKTQRNRSIIESQKNDLIKSTIQNMNSCAQENSTYLLNENAFSNHSSNFRYDSIHNLFCKIGINGVPRLALKNTDLINILAKKYTVDSNIGEKVLISMLTSELEDLAQRRNEIAHGSFDGDLDSIEIVIERALLLKCFGNSISEVLTNYFNNFIFSESNKIDIGKPEKVFKDKRVFGFLANQSNSNSIITEIKTGDIIFSVNDASDNKIMHGKITSILINNLLTESIQLPSPTDFSFQVDFKFSSHMKNRNIYIASQNN
jgi:hypothetical protein